MNEDTYYRCNPHRALYGMRNLDPAQRGAYRTLIDLYYIAGGPLEDNEKYLAAQNGCSIRMWRALRQQLIDLGRIRVEAGFIFDDGCDAELIDRAEAARKAEENGRIGGKKSAAQRAARLRPNADSAPTQPRPSAESTPSQLREFIEKEYEVKENNALGEGGLNQETKHNIDKPAAAAAREGAGDASLIEIWKARLLEVAGPGLGDPAKLASLHTSASVMAAWAKAGVDLEADAVLVIRARTAKPRASPIRSWSLLTDDVMAAKARREQQLKTPEIFDADASDPNNHAAAGHNRRGVHGEGRKPYRGKSGGGGLAGAMLRAEDRRARMERREDAEPEDRPLVARVVG